MSALLVMGAAAHGQAPRITERGDPSVRDDTIYRLAVDSVAYPGQASVLLFSDGVIRIEGGRATRTWRSVTQVLRESGVKGAEERQFTFSPKYEAVTINWMRVVRPDGTVISAKPSQIQEGAVGASADAPTNRRVIRASLSGVAPGTIVDISWTAEQQVRFRDFYQTWRVTPGKTVRRSRLLIDVPEEMTLRVAEHNLNFARREGVVGHRMVYEWATGEVPWVKPEAYAPAADSNDQGMAVTVANPDSWSGVGQWYAGVVRGHFRATSRLRDTVARVVAHATAHEDSIKAVHRWVAQGLRSVTVSFGGGGYRPRSPDEVMASGFGDSRDKAALFIAALSVIGVDAYPVLLDAGGEADRDLPAMSAFNHEIVAIKQSTGYGFVDPSAELTPFGTLPHPDQGQFGLIVYPNGDTEQITTPPEPIEANGTSTHVVGVLDSSGALRGRAEISARGTWAVGLRAVAELGMDSTQRAEFLHEAAEEAFPNAEADSLVASDPKDLNVEPRLSFVVHSERASQRSGATDVLVMPDASAEWGQAADALEANMPRRMRIDAARVFGLVTLVEMRITLPAGWRARLPASVTATSMFGTYEATYRQEGRDLIIVRRTAGARGVVSKDHVGELIAWFRAVAKDRVPFIILDHS